MDFVFAGGRVVGLGHVVRSAALAVEARRRGWGVRAYLEGDGTAASIWRERTGCATDGRWTDWPAGGRPSVVALDFPALKSPWLARAERAGVQSLVVDDDRSVGRATWVLLPGLHHTISRDARGAAPRATANDIPTGRFVGPKYAILQEAHRRVVPQPSADRSRVLVSLGGADPHAITPRVTAALKRARATTRTPIEGVDVVLGAAFSDPVGRFAASLGERGFEVHHALSAADMAGRMARARLAIVGFGTSLTELAWHATPFLCVTHHARDLAPARALERAGIGRVLGSAGDLEPNALEADIAASLDDRAWQRRSAAHGRTAVEGGLGAQRLFAALEQDPRLVRRPRLAQPAGDAKPGPGRDVRGDV